MGSFSIIQRQAMSTAMAILLFAVHVVGCGSTTTEGSKPDANLYQPIQYALASGGIIDTDAGSFVDIDGHRWDFKGFQNDADPTALATRVTFKSQINGNKHFIDMFTTARNLMRNDEVEGSTFIEYSVQNQLQYRADHAVELAPLSSDLAGSAVLVRSQIENFGNLPLGGSMDLPQNVRNAFVGLLILLKADLAIGGPSSVSLKWSLKTKIKVIGGSILAGIGIGVTAIGLIGLPYTLPLVKGGLLIFVAGVALAADGLCDGRYEDASSPHQVDNPPEPHDDNCTCVECDYIIPLQIYPVEEQEEAVDNAIEDL